MGEHTLPGEQSRDFQKMSTASCNADVDDMRDMLNELFMKIEALEDIVESMLMQQGCDCQTTT